MLFRYGQYWYGNDKIGSTAGELRAPAGSGRYPPVKGWEHWNNGGYAAEPTLECGPPLPSCKAVNVEISGKYLYAIEPHINQSILTSFLLISPK